MNNFTENVLKSFNRGRNVLLDYEIYEKEKLYKAELDITYHYNYYYMTYSFFLKDYEEAIDLYQTYLHRKFVSLNDLYTFIVNEESINVGKFEKLLEEY